MTNTIFNKVLYIIMFIVPVATLPADIFPLYNIVRYVILLGCGITLFIALFKKRNELKFDKIDKTLLVLLVILFISTIFSIKPFVSIIGTGNRLEGLLMFCVYILTYYTAKYYFEYNEKIRKYSIFIIVFVCIIGILQYYNIFPIYHIFNIKHLSSYSTSTFGNSNFFGSFLSMVVPIFMAIYINNSKKRYLFFSGLTFLALIASLARSAWVGLAVASIIGLIYVVKNANKYMYIRTLHIICLFIVIFAFIYKSPEIFSMSNKLNSKIFQTGTDIYQTIENGELIDTTGSGRIGIWKMAIKLIPFNPLIGFGPDTFAYAGAYYLPQDMYNCCKASGVIADKAHNEYLQYAVTIGIPGLFVYLLFIYKILEKQKDIFTNKITLLFSVAIIAYLVQAFFNISTIGVAPIFWLLLGLIQNDKFKSKIKI